MKSMRDLGSCRPLSSRRYKKLRARVLDWKSRHRHCSSLVLFANEFEQAQDPRRSSHDFGKSESVKSAGGRRRKRRRRSKAGGARASKTFLRDKELHHRPNILEKSAVINRAGHICVDVSADAGALGPTSSDATHIPPQHVATSAMPTGVCCRNLAHHTSGQTLCNPADGQTERWEQCLNGDDTRQLSAGSDQGDCQRRHENHRTEALVGPGKPLCLESLCSSEPTRMGPLDSFMIDSFSRNKLSRDEAPAQVFRSNNDRERFCRKLETVAPPNYKLAPQSLSSYRDGEAGGHRNTYFTAVPDASKLALVEPNKQRRHPEVRREMSEAQERMDDGFGGPLSPFSSEEPSDGGWWRRMDDVGSGAGQAAATKEAEDPPCVQECCQPAPVPTDRGRGRCCCLSERMAQMVYVKVECGFMCYATFNDKSGALVASNAEQSGEPGTSSAVTPQQAVKLVSELLCGDAAVTREPEHQCSDVSDASQTQAPAVVSEDCRSSELDVTADGNGSLGKLQSSIAVPPNQPKVPLQSRARDTPKSSLDEGSAAGGLASKADTKQTTTGQEAGAPTSTTQPKSSPARSQTGGAVEFAERRSALICTIGLLKREDREYALLRRSLRRLFHRAKSLISTRSLLSLEELAAQVSKYLSRNKPQDRALHIVDEASPALRSVLSMDPMNLKSDGLLDFYKDRGASVLRSQLLAYRIMEDCVDLDLAHYAAHLTISTTCL